MANNCFELEAAAPPKNGVFFICTINTPVCTRSGAFEMPINKAKQSFTTPILKSDMHHFRKCE